MKADVTVDCVGLYCPMPIVHTAKKIKDMHNQNSTHFTLCEVSETHFNTTRARQAIENARDWRLVIVESARLNSKKVWKNSYQV